MVEEISGNLLDSPAEAIVNTVNTVGVMGKGIALQFKKKYPLNFKAYKAACAKGEVVIGKMFITREGDLLSPSKIIINFPTKTTWQAPSEYSYIQKGLEDLRRYIISEGIKSIAIPALGAGNGRLNWASVKQLILDELKELDCKIYLYAPNYSAKERSVKKQVKLTPARAMLLAILYDLVKEGEFVSEFAGEKAAYFLKRFGGDKAFKNLEYKPHFYGPYSAKVNHVLHYLNGSYIKGYYSKEQKPFEEIGLIMEAEKNVTHYLAQAEHSSYLAIVEKTKHFLSGFYSSFGLELLSSIDYICKDDHQFDLKKIKTTLQSWNRRKAALFTDDHSLKVAIKHLRESALYSS